MKRTVILLFLSLLPGIFLGHAKKTDSVYELLQRVTSQSKLPVSLEIKDQAGKNYYQYDVRKGVLHLKGSNEVALCRGFYDYLKSHHRGMYSWSANSIDFPSELEETASQQRVSSFKHHYYLNVVTSGYSAPYWDWARWEQEIDWMALHGIDMPLALVGYEAILARVWKKMGLTEEEINAYFVGPAHLPWMRMGNISGVDGPLNADWHADQVALQHKILQRMRALGMSPICPGFAGFIPESFKRIYPDLNLVETHWGGAFHNWMISPEEPLFTKIAKEFIKEWEKEFGKNDYYLVDSFNEMEIPFPEKGNPKRYEMAAHYGQCVYEGIKAANPKAVWVMQGWMFGYQRHIWDYETLGALVSKVPDDKMLLLDLAVDYNRHFWKSQVNWEFYKGFYNKLWVYSVIPNMGGKVGMTGVLDFYANGRLEALSSPNRGNLFAYGLAPEGIENNEVLYELVTDAGWSDGHIDVRKWLEAYSQNRYGKVSDSLLKAWDLLLESCYGTFTDHPRFNWQLRPGLLKNGTIHISDAYFEGLEQFIQSGKELGDNVLFKNDLIEMTAHYLGGKAEILTEMIDQEYLLGDTTQAEFLQSRFKTVMLGMDALLSQHPLFRLDRWLDFAKNAARTDQQKLQYLTNAKRIVTIWGPPVDDYSARIWSGLVKDYYLERWMHYFESRKTGKPFDFAAWERNWVENGQDVNSSYASLDVVSFAKNMLDITKDISKKNIKIDRKDVIGYWSLNKQQKKVVTLDISSSMLKKMHGFRLESLKGDVPVKVLSFKLVADGKKVVESNLPVSSRDHQIECSFTLPEEMSSNNGCVLSIELLAEENAAGTICIK